MIANGYEVKGNTWIISNYPRITSWHNFECTSRLYLCFISMWIYYLHTSRDNITNVVLWLLTRLQPRMHRPSPARFIGSNSNGSSSKSCMRTCTAVNKLPYVACITRITFKNAWLWNSIWFCHNWLTIFNRLTMELSRCSVARSLLLLQRAWHALRSALVICYIN